MDNYLCKGCSIEKLREDLYELFVSGEMVKVPLTPLPRVLSQPSSLRGTKGNR